MLLAPDFIGLGESDTYHPYMHTTSTVHASVDFIRAAAAHCRNEGIGQKLKEHGGNVELIAVGDLDHASVVFHAVPMVQEWFAQVADG